MNRIKQLAFRLDDLALGMRELLAKAAEQGDTSIRLADTILIVTTYANGLEALSNQLKREVRDEAA